MEDLEGILLPIAVAVLIMAVIVGFRWWQAVQARRRYIAEVRPRRKRGQ